jgi:hypothetical protein
MGALADLDLAEIESVLAESAGVDRVSRMARTALFDHLPDVLRFSSAVAGWVG